MLQYKRLQILEEEMTNNDYESNLNDANCNEKEGHKECCCDNNHDHKHEAVVTFENEDGTTEDHPIIDEFEYNDNIYGCCQNC